MHRLLYELVETVEDDVDVARVGRFVEHGVEVDADVRVGADELAEVDVLLPRAHRVALDEPVRLVALETGLDECEQQSLREVEAVARVEIAPHAFGAHDEAFDDPG